MLFGHHVLLLYSFLLLYPSWRGILISCSPLILHLLHYCITVDVDVL